VMILSYLNSFPPLCMGFVCTIIVALKRILRFLSTALNGSKFTFFFRVWYCEKNPKIFLFFLLLHEIYTWELVQTTNVQNIQLWIFLFELSPLPNKADFSRYYFLIGVMPQQHGPLLLSLSMKNDNYKIDFDCLFLKETNMHPAREIRETYISISSFQLPRVILC